MCLDRGRKPSINELKAMSGWTNIELLNIWHSIGADVEHGLWTTYGARMGTYMCMLDPNWNYTEVQSFDKLSDIFNSVNALTPQQRREHYAKISQEIRAKLGLPCIDMGSEQSAFWKKYYTRLHRNKGIMDI